MEGRNRAKAGARGVTWTPAPVFAGANPYEAVGAVGQSGGRVYERSPRTAGRTLRPAAAAATYPGRVEARKEEPEGKTRPDGSPLGGARGRSPACAPGYRG